MTEITMEDLERARKKAARREKIDQFMNDVEIFYQGHKELVIPVLTGAVIQGGRIALKALQLSTTNREIDYKNRHVYDPRTGCYLEVKHKLNSSEAVRLNELRGEGYSVTEALEKMKVLR